MKKLYCGDCLIEMDKIPDGSVDLILTDPPYGTTACKWDSVIPFESMWERLNRIIKPNGAIVLFGSEPFSSALRMSNIKNYKYDWIWDKMQGANFYLAKRMPLKSHENISIFYDTQPTYNAQMTKPLPKNMRDRVKNYQKGTKDTVFGDIKKYIPNKNENTRYPLSVYYHSSQSNELHKTKRLHPTQKPVALMEYLIKTYTNEGETVLDFTMGSGTTGVACVRTNRKFIGIELDKDYFEIAKKRINNENLRISV